MSNKILFLEDDALFAESVIDFLEEEGYEVHFSPNGESALEATYEQKFSLYLLDINVPLIDGLTFLKELRESNDETPAIFLTSHKDKEVLKNSFAIGADDYLSKPFDIDELLLRIEALLRRVKKVKHKCINLLCHDEVHKRILYDGDEIDLSKKEYELLLILMQHANQVVPRELMIDSLWSCSKTGSTGAIRVYINRIKQLIPALDIQNIRGIGYKLVS
ncbi:MAG: response regulator transcription factor [Sulfurimonadaceae bacterium]|nr:response regulator transcription factor [Sulfurimonadaceae bacterium]